MEFVGGVSSAGGGQAIDAFNNQASISNPFIWPIKVAILFYILYVVRVGGGGWYKHTGCFTKSNTKVFAY